MHSKAAGSVSAAELAAFTARSNRGAQRPRPRGTTRPAKVGGAMRSSAAAPDGSLIQMQEMQRKMMEMQRELSTLRGAVPAGVADKQQQVPLTYHEKKMLIEAINEMPSEHMERVIIIVQEATRATASGDDDEDIEIPLDELDTGTLRKLQRLVEEVMPNKKRQAPPVDASDVPAPKRQVSRKSGGFEEVYQPTAVKVEHAIGAAPAAPAIEAPTEDYGDLFSTDKGGSTLVAANTDAWALAVY